MAGDWQTLVRPPVKVRDSMPLIQLLAFLREKRSHLALVYGPDNRLEGIVTLEDIIEEIVGEIYDELDDQYLMKMLATDPKVRALSSGASKQL